MLAASSSNSPTFSATSSPTFRTRSRHASRSSSHHTQSPRTYQIFPDSRRPDAPAAPLTAPPAAPTVSNPGRQTVDAGTQYTPQGYPPTAQRPIERPIDIPRSEGTLPRSNSTTKRRAASTTTTTDPPEPEVRQAPQTPSKNARASEPASASASAPVLQAGQPSPQKRIRPSSSAVKVMPVKYETCDVKDLGVLISDMLIELVRINDGFPLKDGQLTRFHSRAPPGISIRDYLFRLIIHATLSPPILLSMVYYVDRLCLLYPAFTISSLTVHRFLIASATVAAKGLSDSFWTNNTYARVGGVSTRELALLELEFLTRVDWKIVPKPEVLVDYYVSLVGRSEGYVLESLEPAKQ
ncbi:hypothetical protein W97_00983 [Coniosporium apollinis CBS 100218]|uniref:Phosphate system cyclin PHO80 n=1 Tax=Coniosporium apollinis (strain CBS 100218) TaxID=1168221 RepID=R7YIL8_CONA1|nr:uncharacterized protein W97_00983 [Coniosporium apollinis CBS 100218]EON61767.1 hypothetical protein W97_00983 [Coniosporium apollinis CBS 100218]